MLGLMPLKAVIGVVISRPDRDARNRFPTIGGTYGTYGGSFAWTGIP